MAWPCCWTIRAATARPSRYCARRCRAFERRWARATLISLNTLAEPLRVQGRYADAEPLLREALQASRDPAVLGPAHPQTLKTQLNLVKLLAAEGRVAEAARLQQAMEPQVLTWLGA